MTLFLYFGRRFLSSFLKVFLVLSLLILVLETLENVRALSANGVSFGQSVMLAALSTPALVAQALPVATMLGGLTFCVGLALSNEFVVTRAAGVPALKAMAVPALYAGAIGAAAVLFLDPLAASLSSREEVLRDSYTGHARRPVSFSAEGFWLRQKNSQGHAVIHAKGALGTGGVLRDATAFVFDEAGEISGRIFSRTVILSEGQWIFTNGKRWVISRDEPNPETSSERFEILRFPTNITPEQIREGYPKPENVPIWQKAQMIRTIGAAGFSTLPHRLHLHAELARPLALVAMMIIGAAFTLQNARLGNLGISVFLALACGFSLYFLQNLAMTLGEAGEIPVFAAAWAPPLAAIFIAIGLFLRFEDG